MPTPPRRALAPLLALLLLAGACQSPHVPQPTPPNAPYVLVLGTAQDGGQPQVGCNGARCEAARANPAGRRLVTSLLLADPASGQRFLFDASPDLTLQVEAARPHPISRPESPGRPPLFDGIFLTHAHMGHYAGLLQLGREAYGTRGQRLFVSPRLASFFSSNAPWNQMLERGTFELDTMQSGQPLALTDGLTVTALRVPHRDEYSDTVGFIIRSPRAALFYLPDIDKWERWTDTRIEDVIASVDFALIDGTFFTGGEIPGRAMDAIPHPFIVESMARFQTLPDTERAKIFFTHFNHTNPASDTASPEAAAVRAAGFGLAREGQLFEL